MRKKGISYGYPVTYFLFLITSSVQLAILFILHIINCLENQNVSHPISTGFNNFEATELINMIVYNSIWYMRIHHQQDNLLFLMLWNRFLQPRQPSDQYIVPIPEIIDTAASLL